MKVDHYSHSAYNRYQLCPKKFELQAKHPEVEHPSNKYMDFGIRYHKEVENYHNGLPHDHGLIASYKEEFPQDFFDIVEYKMRVVLKWGNNKIETPFEMRIDGANREGIWDIKTVGTAGFSKKKANTSDQATLYCMGWHLEYGGMPTFHYIVYSRKGGKITHRETYREETNFEALFDKMLEFDGKVQADEFPANVGAHCLECPFATNGMCLNNSLYTVVKNKYEGQRYGY